MASVISKEEYVLNRVEAIVDYYVKENREFNPSNLKELIKQWLFDYEMEKKYRPEVLNRMGNLADDLEMICPAELRMDK